MCLTSILRGAAVLTQLCLNLTQTGYLDPSAEGLGPALPSGLGYKTGKHTDLLIMAKQLRDQGSLSKNLQEREREGAVYRRARPSLGYSGLFPTPYRFCFEEVLLGFLRDGKLTSRADIIEDMFSRQYPGPPSPGQCHFRATDVAQDMEDSRCFRTRAKYSGYLGQAGWDGESV